MLWSFVEVASFEKSYLKLLVMLFHFYYDEKSKWGFVFAHQKGKLLLSLCLLLPPRGKAVTSSKCKTMGICRDGARTL